MEPIYVGRDHLKREDDISKRAPGTIVTNARVAGVADFNLPRKLGRDALACGFNYYERKLTRGSKARTENTRSCRLRHVVTFFFLSFYLSVFLPFFLSLARELHTAVRKRH